MKGTNLGELEELLLLIILNLKEEAYGLAIKNYINQHCGRSVSISTVHATLHRLETKGFVESSYNHVGLEDRGGRPKLIFKITPTGQVTLQKVKDLRDQLWSGIPNLSTQ